MTLTHSVGRNNYGAPYPPARSWRDADYPCWWEFVQFLLQSNPHSYDEHWKPASLYCSVCNSLMEYQYILKFENILQEETFFAEAISAGDVIRPRWENKNSNDNTSRDEVLNIYFDQVNQDKDTLKLNAGIFQLSDADIEGLYRIYEKDFKLFGYEFRFRNVEFN